MEINEFIKATEKLEKYYDKEYTEEQRKIMYDRLKDISINEFNRAINIMLDKCKYLPKISDIKAGLAEPNNPIVNKPKIDFSKCKKCSYGFVHYYKDVKDGDKVIQYEYVALCDCENGKKQKEINGLNLPFISQIKL